MLRWGLAALARGAIRSLLGHGLDLRCARSGRADPLGIAAGRPGRTAGAVAPHGPTWGPVLRPGRTGMAI